jgi:hypothetical protein
MDHSIRLSNKHLAQSGKFGISVNGGNNMHTTHTIIDLMGNRLFDVRRQTNPFTRVILFFRILGNESPSSTEVARLAQIARNTRSMVDIGPIIRNR